MKRIGVLAVIITVFVMMSALCVFAQEAKVFNVYADKMSPDNHYIPSGWMGDYGDIKMTDESMDNPHSGSTSIKFIYSAKKAGGQGWAGVYWQNPANNWGSKDGGFDLSGMTKLSFWARGAKGGEIIDKVIVGGIKGVYPDSDEIEIGPIELTTQWQEFTVNLAGKNLSYISGGFGWVINADRNPEGAEFYIDDIKYVADPEVKPQMKGPEELPFYIYLDKGSINNHYIPSGWMGDYGDIKIDAGSKDDPYMGNSCIKIVYSGVGSQGARWAGVYWQNPPNNWGEKDGGFDLSNATKITFWARGENGGERLEEFKAGGLFGEYSDSDVAGIGPVLLTKEWKQYTIDLTGKDFSYIIGGFCWATNVDVNPEGATFYLDEIRYE
ncbi:MAG: hypothetical protein COV72_03725 [Candidatus Omnitrophica bacterium CG11_big_fil_rev_8_21_14_0_20_42_13]|uniref:CBM11 domain-containing protein n=1 Tax=Candidatus Ghiorseimicrobium undicola TaxID=1974746 RepID=A0A2H0LY39_9BACT|nr:MAG: hypothetical protein COV72_03725 [Candidatus Omnitrophica bacterium CG11_big_fil_rev_8_21_14_0_20_42_13]